MDHDESPFTVVGIIARTFTPIDRALYVTLDGIHAMHEGWQSGMPPSVRMNMPGAGSPPSMPGGSPPVMPGANPPAMPGSAPPAAAADTAAGADSHGDAEEVQITAIFLGARNRAHALQIQREVNTYSNEPLTAVIPAAVLYEMWEGLNTAEVGLRVITFFVVAVGLLGMLVSLYSSLSARRREMAILRAIGAGPGKIISLLVLESGIMSVIGSLIGVAVVYALLLVGGPLIEQRFGLYVPIRALGQVEYIYIAVVCAAGFLIGFVPAYKAYRNTLADGLSVRL
jgi:putative ABC transport system permease protein